MTKLLQKILAEPVASLLLLLAFVIAVLIQLEVVTIGDLNEFVATVAAVIPILLTLWGLRKLVSPASGDAAAVRQNAVIAETLARVASGEIPPKMWGGQ